MSSDLLSRVGAFFKAMLNSASDHLNVFFK
jgi:hypothetical protein